MIFYSFLILLIFVNKKLVTDNTEANKSKIIDKMRKQILAQDEEKMSDMYEKKVVIASVSILLALTCIFPLFYITNT